jgi:hypothetical protein
MSATEGSGSGFGERTDMFRSGCSPSNLSEAVVAGTVPAGAVLGKRSGEPVTRRAISDPGSRRAAAAFPCLR